MKELNSIISQDACGERLLGLIVRELEVLKERVIIDDDLDHAIELGKKLLTYHYFDNVEEDLNNLDYNNLERIEIAALMGKYSDTALEKRNDYEEFFGLLAKNIEVWC